MTATQARTPEALFALREAADPDASSWRWSAIDAMVDDAWQRIAPTDQRWHAIYELLSTDLPGDAEAFAPLNDFAQRLLLQLAALHAEHLNEGALWKDVHNLEGMVDEFRVLVAELKAALA